MTWAPPKVSLSDRINQQQSKTIESEFQRGRLFGKDTRRKNGEEGVERRSNRERVCVMVEDTCSDVETERKRV
jgi:hypothetical protein